MLAVLGAKHELGQQIFTKTMTIQVWKPDNERAGRHFVYTSRYVQFFVVLLLKTNDKESIEMLARRIRKKSGEFVNHEKIWQDVSWAYLKVSYSSFCDTFELTKFSYSVIQSLFNLHMTS